MANVVGVGVGAKETEGRLVDGKLGLTILVDRKLPKRRLAKNDCVPPRIELEGVAADTDVVLLEGVAKQRQRATCFRRGMAAAPSPGPEMVIQGGIDIGPEGEATRGTLTNIYC